VAKNQLFHEVMAALAAGLLGLGGGLVSDFIGNEYAATRQAKDLAFQREGLALQQEMFRANQRERALARSDAADVGIPYAFVGAGKAPSYQTWQGNRFSGPTTVLPSKAGNYMGMMGQAFTRGVYLQDRDAREAAKLKQMGAPTKLRDVGRELPRDFEIPDSVRNLFPQDPVKSLIYPGQVPTIYGVGEQDPSTLAARVLARRTVQQLRFPNNRGKPQREFMEVE